MNWCRLWHDMPNDPKWRTVAKISKQPITSVICVYLHLMVSASANATERGRTQTNAEDLASALDLETDQVESILDAMQGRVLMDSLLSGWGKRQPKREDESAERSREWREEQKRKDLKTPERNRTQPNATERDVTQCDAPDKRREDTDTDNTPPTPSNGKVSDDQLQEISDAFDRHMCHHNLQPRDLVIQQVLSMNGKFTWEKFRSNHQQYCDYWSQKGWNFCKVTFLGWVNAGMPPAPGLNAGPPIQMPPRGPCGKCGKDPCECHRAKHAKMMEDLDRAKAARV